MIRKLKSGEYRLYSRKKDAKSGKRKNLGTFSSRSAAEKHERAVQYFKRAVSVTPGAVPAPAAPRGRPLAATGKVRRACSPGFSDLRSWTPAIAVRWSVTTASSSETYAEPPVTSRYTRWSPVSPRTPAPDFRNET